MPKLKACALFLLSAFALGIAASAPAWADAGDQDRAREAMLRGDIAPLADALRIIERQYPGEILEVELEEEDDFNPPVFLYEIKVLSAQGEVLKVKLHAKDLEIIEVKGHDKKKSKKDEKDEQD